MAEAFGPDRRAALCRELTKTHEEVVRDTLTGLMTWVGAQEHGVRGEVTLVVEGGKPAQFDDDGLRQLVAAAEGRGLTRKDAIVEVAQSTGVRRRAVYEAVHHA
jgi:16S rRNA (cytidine1402-2'-O)-methyltransferase